VLICVARLGLSGRILVYFCAVRVSPPGRLCWRASRPLPNPRGAHGNRGPSRWNRCHTDLSAGQAWYNRRAIRPKRRSLPPEAHALGRLNRRGCVGYNERGARLQRERPRLQRAPLSLNSTGLLLVAAVRSLLATSPRVITPLPTRIRGGYDGSIGILRT
jgi:hypothetical protein